jgi:hypothetical protein
MLVIQDAYDRDRSKIPKPPEYWNLLPLVDFLVAHGNTTEGFIGQQSGFNCYLSQPIDFDLLRAEVVLPAGVIASAERDQIFDPKSWATIWGSIAVANAVAEREKFFADRQRNEPST